MLIIPKKEICQQLWAILVSKKMQISKNLNPYLYLYLLYLSRLDSVFFLKTQMYSHMSLLFFPDSFFAMKSRLFSIILKIK